MKISGISVIINIVLIAITDALMYIFVKDWTNTMICSIVVIDLSFVLNMIAFFFIPSHKNSYIFQASSSVLTSILIVLEIILMIVNVFTEKIIGEPYIMVAEVVVFVLFLLLFITNNIVNKHTAETADVNDEGIARVKGITAKLNMALKQAQNPKVKKIIESTYDESRSISSYKKELEEYDNQLLSLADSILNIAADNDEDQISELCSRFSTVLYDRQTKARELQN